MYVLYCVICLPQVSRIKSPCGLQLFLFNFFPEPLLKERKVWAKGYNFIVWKIGSMSTRKLEMMDYSRICHQHVDRTYDVHVLMIICSLPSIMKPLLNGSMIHAFYIPASRCLRLKGHPRRSQSRA